MLHRIIIFACSVINEPLHLQVIDSSVHSSVRTGLIYIILLVFWTPCKARYINYKGIDSRFPLSNNINQFTVPRHWSDKISNEPSMFFGHRENAPSCSNQNKNPKNKTNQWTLNVFRPSRKRSNNIQSEVYREASLSLPF